MPALSRTFEPRGIDTARALSSTVHGTGTVAAAAAYRPDALAGEVAELDTAPCPSSTAVDVGLLIPMHGSAGIFGLSCLLCGALAAEQINAEGGLLGRELHLRPIDGAGRPPEVAGRISRLLRAGCIQAVAGWHLSHVRKAVAKQLEGTVPYVYSALYEGGERSPGVLLAGETPDRQLRPAMGWLSQELGVRRWAIVGDDYLWPRGSAAAVQAHAAELGLRLTDQVFVPLGQEDFGDVLRRLQRSDVQGVLMLLVGQDAVHFNREFAAAGLDERMVRLSSLMDENMLLASGPDGTRELYSSAGYFADLATPDALDLTGRYTDRFGVDAPVLNSMGESCFEALSLLATLVRRAGSFDVARLLGTAERPVGFHGPRGSVHLEDRHLVQDVYLARADGLDFDIVARL